MTEIPDASSTPPLPLVLPDSRDERSYYDNNPSGQYRRREGVKVWTDCSRKQIGVVKMVGAGVVQLHEGEITLTSYRV
eukprot:439306-Rhodomonas_salina.1